mgnify:CR=1 FL=1
MSRRAAAFLAVATLLAACSAAETEDAATGEEAVTAHTLFDDKPLVSNGRDEAGAVPTTGSVITEIVQP